MIVKFGAGDAGPPSKSRTRCAAIAAMAEVTDGGKTSPLEKRTFGRGNRQPKQAQPALGVQTETLPPSARRPSCTLACTTGFFKAIAVRSKYRRAESLLAAETMTSAFSRSGRA